MHQFTKFFSIVSIFVAISFSAVSEEVKRQAIPVGMFNVYSREDGNLGLPTPDLQEVWQGMPMDWGGGYYPYEACNLVHHYWPSSLPRGFAGQDANAAWWIDYLRQVYEAGNENGEVRLRAIVGALYEPYEAYGEAWLINFIKTLCEWEQSGPQNGVIAGWYLAEEPMGSAHNYNVGVFDDMVAAIEYAESEGGYRRHDRYVDVALGGAHYSPQNLIRFTRAADVVMISGGTYLWQISGAQPVYYPKWENIHINLYHARNIIFPDRDRNGLPRPEIHVVLEIYDTKGYGQPTNWEIRQQIRTALSPDVKIYGKTSEPADGIWFFWWTGLTFENEDRVSDWVFGRRVAEAIEMEVAEMTGNRREIQSQNMPLRSRFAFSDTGAFNPDESTIPYELSEPGKVQIEVLDADMTLMDTFDMGVQSAGLLHHFGGPRWTLSSYEPDGEYIFRLYVDSILMDTAKVEVQSRPGLISLSHIPEVWSKENVVKVAWRPPALSSGLRGFSYLWNTSPSSYPEQTANLSPSSRELESEPLPDGNSHYFHLRSVDNEGNWSSPAHLGPFYIDTTPPSPITDLVSVSHAIGQSRWSTDNTIDISWTPARDSASGLRGYSYLWDTSESTLPPPLAKGAGGISSEAVNLGWAVTSISSEPLPDGQWYFHIRGVDAAGNWNNEARHLGPFGIDTQPPSSPRDLTSISHQVAVWSNQNEIVLSWQSAEDEVSGIAGYLALWDASDETAPTISDAQISLISGETHSFTLPDGNSHYFHLRSMDRAGQLSAETSHLGPFYIDTTPPSAVNELTLFDNEGQARNPQDWLRDGNVRLQWQRAEDEGSGIAGYAIVLQMGSAEWKGGRVEGWKEGEDESIQEYIPTAPLSDGEWIFQVRPQDVAGNLGEISEITARIDSYLATPKVNSPSHPDSERWYPDNTPIFRWTFPTKVGHPTEDISGIAGYSWAWDNSPATVPDETLELPGDATTFQIPSSDGVWYFHLKARDNAGNVSETAHYKVQIDASAPQKPIIISDTHPAGKWISERNIRFRWNPAKPVNLSGISGVSFLLDKNPIGEPDEKSIEKAIHNFFESVEEDGIWYIHLKLQSGAGLWSETAHYEVRIDTAAPKLTLSSPTHSHSDRWYADNSPTMKWDLA
ncbi:MAG: Ig-like domain repeat protein, partial [Candidatus Poribacteria bacterium]